MANPEPQLDCRTEVPEDREAVRTINELAFRQADEADLVDALRENAHPTISLVAAIGTETVGHIFFSPVSLEPPDPAFRAMGLGPMAVRPDRQNQGVGSRLVRRGLQECERLGYDVVVVFGHPDFYPRFGFVAAKARGLTCEYPAPDEVFMVAELTAGALAGKTGLVKYRPEFGTTA